MPQRPDQPAKPLSETSIRKIGQKLRENYDKVANEPVPDRFRSLLDQLEQAETKKADNTGDKNE